MNKKYSEALQADENVPERLKEKIRKLNAQLSAWDQTGSVRRDYAEAELDKAKAEMMQIIKADREGRIAHMRQQEKAARESYEKDHAQNPAVAMLRMQDASFKAEGLSDAEIKGFVGSLQSARDEEAALELFESGDILKAVLREANRRNIPVTGAHAALKNLSLEPIHFEKRELPILRKAIAAEQALPPDTFRLHFTREDDPEKSGSIVVSVDSFLETDLLKSLPERSS